MQEFFPDRVVINSGASGKPRPTHADREPIISASGKMRTTHANQELIISASDKVRRTHADRELIVSASGNAIFRRNAFILF